MVGRLYGKFAMLVSFRLCVDSAAKMCCANTDSRRP